MISKLARICLLAILATGLLVGTAHAIGVEGDLYASPIVIPGAGGSSTTPVTGAFTEPGENPGLPGDTPWDWTVWYSWTMPSAATAAGVPARADLCGPDLAHEPGFITKLSYRQASVGIGGTALASTDTGCPPKGGPYTVARIDFTAAPGTDYRFAAGSGPTALGSLTFTLQTAPYATTLPAVSGAAKVGETLTAVPATWTLAGGLVDPPTWQRCGSGGSGCVAILGATTSSYQLQMADVGATIRVAYSGHSDVGATSATSPTSAVVEAATVVLVPPVPPTLPAPKLDTDGDGVPDTIDGDDDGDGLLDVIEVAYGYNPLKVDSNGDGRKDGDDACRSFGLCGNVVLGAGGKVLIVPDAPRTSSGIRTVTGTTGNDSIFNTIGTSNLRIDPARLLSLLCNGGGGDDSCFGGRATDICVAGVGSDTCIGNGGTDSCTSTSGTDTCIGGAGTDTCTAKLTIDPLVPTKPAPAPVVGCEGGAGDDTCTTTIATPTKATLALDEQLIAYLTKLGTTTATCTGGTGSDMCKVASRTWDPVTAYLDFGLLSFTQAVAVAPGLETTCSGGAGNDTCVAADAFGWADGYVGAVGSTTTCIGGEGDDLLMTLNGSTRDVIIGTAGDVCYADKGDTVSGCGTTIVMDGLSAFSNAQLSASIAQGAGSIASGWTGLRIMELNADTDAAREQKKILEAYVVVAQSGQVFAQEAINQLVTYLGAVQSITVENTAPLRAWNI